jgi:hypothetical protein
MNAPRRSCGAMELHAFVDGRRRPFDPLERGELLLGNAGAVSRLQGAPLRAVMAAIAIGIACAAIALVLTNAWFLVAMGGMFSVAWVYYKRWKGMPLLDEVKPGIYDNGVQLAEPLFIPFDEIAAAGVSSPSLPASGDVIRMYSVDGRWVWSLPLQVVGSEGFEVIREMSGAGHGPRPGGGADRQAHAEDVRDASPSP